MLGNIPATESWKLMQVGVVVADINSAIEKFGALGIGPFEMRTLPPDREEYYRGKPHRDYVKIAMAKMGDTQLELIQPLQGPSVHREYLDSKGEGIQHVMFGVDNLQDEVRRLVGRGAIELMSSNPSRVPGAPGVVYLGLGAGGVILELVQKRPSA